MSIWFGLLVAPTLALADQVVAYATVDWACSHGHAIAVHLVHASFLAVTSVATFAAWRLWSGRPRARAQSEAVVLRRFLVGLAMFSSALSALVIAAMWMPTWVIGPCVN